MERGAGGRRVRTGDPRDRAVRTLSARADRRARKTGPDRPGDERPDQGGDPAARLPPLRRLDGVRGQHSVRGSRGGAGGEPAHRARLDRQRRQHRERRGHGFPLRSRRRSDRVRGSPVAADPRPSGRRRAGRRRHPLARWGHVRRASRCRDPGAGFPHGRRHGGGAGRDAALRLSERTVRPPPSGARGRDTRPGGPHRRLPEGAVVGHGADGCHRPRCGSDGRGPRRRGGAVPGEDGGEGRDRGAAPHERSRPRSRGVRAALDGDRRASQPVRGTPRRAGDRRRPAGRHGPRAGGHRASNRLGRRLTDRRRSGDPQADSCRRAGRDVGSAPADSRRHVHPSGDPHRLGSRDSLALGPDERPAGQGGPPHPAWQRVVRRELRPGLRAKDLRGPPGGERHSAARVDRGRAQHGPGRKRACQRRGDRSRRCRGDVRPRRPAIDRGGGPDRHEPPPLLGEARNRAGGHVGDSE